MEKIKIGIFGINRGASYINSLLANDAEIVAICDKDEFWLNKAKEIMGDKTTYYTSFMSFMSTPWMRFCCATTLMNMLPTPFVFWKKAFTF